MALVTFTRWCLNAKDRTDITVNTERVDAVEHWGDAFVGYNGEKFPAACKLIMKGKQEYVVQGSVAEVTLALIEGA